jgi:hypothetical protein
MNEAAGSSSTVDTPKPAPSPTDAGVPDSLQAGSHALPARSPLYPAGELGRGACSNTSVRQVIDAVHESHPDLSDITRLVDPENRSDGSFVIAYLRADGGFSLVFKRGDGDCVAGCINNEYWYFNTQELCTPELVGHYRRNASGPCIEEEGIPLWDEPRPTDPLYVCNASQKPEAISGSYRFRVQGEAQPCVRAGEALQLRKIDETITVELKQDSAEPTRGTLTMHGVGHPLIDDRVLPAEFQRRRVTAHEERSNLPSRCPQQSTLDVSYDFEGAGSRQLQLMEVNTPDCNQPDDYCKGYWQLTLSELP